MSTLQTAEEIRSFIATAPVIHTEPEWTTMYCRPSSEYGFLQASTSEEDTHYFWDSKQDLEAETPVQINHDVVLYSGQAEGIRLDAVAHYLDNTKLFDFQPWYGVAYPVVACWKDGCVVMDGHHRLLADRIMQRPSLVVMARLIYKP